MRAPDSPRPRWTPDRQLRFLEVLAITRSVSRAAVLAGMSRESAYRLRRRKDGALCAALWDRIMELQGSPTTEGHTTPLTAGRIMRLLGNHYRRQSGDFSSIGVTAERRLPK